MLVHITVQIGKFDRNINKKEKIRIIRKSGSSSMSEVAKNLEIFVG